MFLFTIILGILFGMLLGMVLNHAIEESERRQSEVRHLRKTIRQLQEGNNDN